MALLPPRKLLPLALLPAALIAWTPAPRAAQSYDSCTGFIDALPATITTQGTWCLRKHLYTSVASGPAISVLADNVTVDCNDHRISGLGAGDATEAVGINTGPSRSNATVRHCRIQGFKYGVVLHGNYHLVEHNRFEGNTLTGIHVSGRGLVIHGNLVADTGGRPMAGAAHGIFAGDGRVQGNTVNGVSPQGTGDGDRFPVGIQIVDGVVRGNRVTGLVTGGQQGLAIGLRMTGVAIARDNTVTQASSTYGYGIRASGRYTAICRQNDVQGYQLAPDNLNCLQHAQTHQ